MLFPVGLDVKLLPKTVPPGKSICPPVQATPPLSFPIKVLSSVASISSVTEPKTSVTVRSKGTLTSNIPSLPVSNDIGTTKNHLVSFVSSFARVTLASNIFGVVTEFAASSASVTAKAWIFAVSTANKPISAFVIAKA